MHAKTHNLKLLVPKNGVAVPTAASKLYNSTTDAYNLLIGSLGAYIPTANSGNHTEATGATTNILKLIARRDTSGDRSPLMERHLEESQWISASCFQGVNLSLSKPRAAANHIVLSGAPVATVNQVPIFNEFTYRFQVTSKGDRVDLLNSVYNHPTSFGTYTTPDWSASTLTDNQKLDLIMSNLAFDFNVQNNVKAVAFAVSYNGGVTGGTTIAAASALAIGSRLVIGYTPTGETVTIVIDRAIRQALVNMAAVVPAATQIRPYLLPGTRFRGTPPTVAISGTTTGTAVADHIAVLSLDEIPAYYDYKMNRKSWIRVGLLEGWGANAPVVVSNVDEGTGSYHQMKILYENIEHTNQTSYPRPFQAMHVAYPNFLLPDATYDLFFIEHCQERISTNGAPNYTPFTTIIALVSYEDPNTPYFTGTENPQTTYIKNLLNAFNTNNNLGNVAL